MIKRHIKEDLRYLFKVFIFINTVFYLNLVLYYEFTLKRVILKTWKKFRKPAKNLPKTFCNPVVGNMLHLTLRWLKLNYYFFLYINSNFNDKPQHHLVYDIDHI